MNRLCIDLCICLILTLLGCGHAVDPGRYVKYMTDPENGLKGTEVKRGYEYEWQFLSAQMCALKELGNKRPDPESFWSLVEEFQGNYYFTLVIRQKPGIPAQNRRVPTAQEIQFQLKPDFKLIAGKEGVSCSGYHVEYMDNDYSQIRMNLIFPKSGDTEHKDILFQFNDRYFSNQMIQFEIDQSRLSKIPLLKI